MSVTLDPVAIAIDAGTTGVRALALGRDTSILDVVYREFPQYFPRPGWVEHDPMEIWGAVEATVTELAHRLGTRLATVASIGITNQRETVVAFDRSNGNPLHRALVWQDRRTRAACESLRAEGHESLIRATTGLVLDPYFSATKMAWLLEQGVPAGPTTAMGTVDSWILWNLTGKARSGVFATDPSNASRTLLYDTHRGHWSSDLCDLFAVPEEVLPEVRPSSGIFGVVAEDTFDGLLAGVPISGIAGDQQAALFGQACFDPGLAKVTIGTGSFILMQAGSSVPDPVDGLISTVAWDLGGSANAPSHAVEGSIFVSGAGVQWLRDGMGIIAASSELEPLARSCESSGGVTFVPALAGLGSPQWDPTARGTIVGLSRGIGRAEIARAMIEAMSFQVADVLAAMQVAGHTPVALRMDGGAVGMDLLLQSIADQVRIPVIRPHSLESTALGAATLAGLAAHTWADLAELRALWREERVFTPELSLDEAEAAHAAWSRAVTRSRNWAEDDSVD